MPTVQTLVRDVDLFLCLGPWSDLAKANLTNFDTLLLWKSDLMHHQYRLSVLQWNAGTPPISWQRLVDGFMPLYFKKTSDHVPHITDQFIAYTGNTDLAILLNKDTCEPDPAVYAFKEASTSKDTWGMVLLIVGDLLRRSSLFLVLRRSHVGPTSSNATSPLCCFPYTSNLGDLVWPLQFSAMLLPYGALDSR